MSKNSIVLLWQAQNCKCGGWPKSYSGGDWRRAILCLWLEQTWAAGFWFA